MRAADAATLATALAGNRDDGDGVGWPYASLVMVACDFDAAPLLLISSLAEHTQNIAGDDRVALLFDGTGAGDDRLSGARVTVLGRARRTGDAAIKARYLARHPSAEGYASFADFSFFRVEVARAHLVAGFGRIDWIAAADLMAGADGAASLAGWEPEFVAEWNEKHAVNVGLLAESLGLDGAGWRMTGCDPEGCDLRTGGQVARLAFRSPVSTPKEVRAALVLLVGKARA